MLNSITCWLDSIAEKYPDKTAFSDESMSLTFSQTRTRAISLAETMIETDASLFKRPVVIYMEKCVEALVCFFATAYSGNFYTPIDIHMPEQRVSNIFKTLNPSVILTKTEYENSPVISNADIPVIYTDKMHVYSDRSEMVFYNRSKTIDTDLLYVLFTSGSTGVPKGVSITHRAVMDYIDCIEDVFGFGSEDSLGNQAPLYFDNSILDIYTPLKTGAEMHIIPEQFFLRPTRLLEYIQKHNINSIFWVPSALISVTKTHALDNCDLSDVLKRVMFCGEVMPNSCLNIWREHLPEVMYANIYGPTEITDACTFYIVDRKFSNDENLPIGKPFSNTEILILNEQDQLVKEDEIGELCVRGTSISMGYYNNPQKTASAFVQNPINRSYPELIYRTGDLVHYNEFGEIMYVGRKDNQIKYMGYRIELGEIETAASSISEISRCACVFDEPTNQLVLFIEGEGKVREIKKQLSDKIPQYMIPKRVINISEMPLNQNGKIDRMILKEMLSEKGTNND